MKMKTLFHILNGDALAERFPAHIQGEKQIARECVIDGPTDAPDLEAFFDLRAKYLSETYGEISVEDYERLTPPEFRAMAQIPEGAEVNLWFEEDLFCVANLWLVCWILQQTERNYTLYWVRPATASPYCFAASSEAELSQLYDLRMPISAECYARLGQCWPHFQQGDVPGLKTQIAHLPPSYHFLKPALQAWEEMLPRPDGWRGRPTETLARLKPAQPDAPFGVIFGKFCETEGVYGMGDLQVKRLWELC